MFSLYVHSISYRLASIIIEQTTRFSTHLDDFYKWNQPLIDLCDEKVLLMSRRESL